METIEIEIKKDFVKSLMESLEKDDAIKIVNRKELAVNAAALIGSLPKQPKEEVDAIINKMREEWQRDF